MSIQTTRVCDRCKKPIGDVNSGYKTLEEVAHHNQTVGDLCSECSVDFDDFMENQVVTPND